MADANEKLLAELLKKPGNNLCADCGAKSECVSSKRSDLPKPPPANETRSAATYALTSPMFVARRLDVCFYHDIKHYDYIM